MAWQSAVSNQRPRDFSSNPRSSVGDYLCTMYKWLLCYHAALRAAASSCHNLHPGNPQTCQTAETEMYANATKGTPIVNSDHGPLHAGVLRYDPRKSPLNFLLADSWTPCAHPHQQAKGAGDKKDRSHIPHTDDAAYQALHPKRTQLAEQAILIRSSAVYSAN